MTDVALGTTEETDTHPVDGYRVLHWQQSVRILSHVAIWTVLLVPTIEEMARGWRAVQDQATISLRSYQVFSLHSPLVGQFSATSIATGHLLYDPGPLQYWILAVPIRIDPARGALWGAALACGLVLSLGVEALWSTGRRWGCGVVGVIALDLGWVVPQLFAQPTWNTYFSTVFMVSTIVLAWVVATGSLGWWPCLVLTASVVIQSELFYGTFAVVVVIAATGVGVFRTRPQRLRWLAVGIVVGAVCWIPAIIQEVFGPSRNLSRLVGNHNSIGLGVHYALKSLALAGSPHPIWIVRDSYPGYLTFGAIVTSGSVTGVLVLVALVAVTAVSALTGRRDLAALSVIGLLFSACTVATIAIIPTTIGRNSLYLDAVLWLDGILIWVIGAWAVIELAKAAIGRMGAAGTKVSAPLTTPVVVMLVGLVVAVVLALGVLSIRGVTGSARSQVDPRQIALIDSTATGIEKATPKGPVTLQVRSDLDWLVEYGIGQGVAWKLTVDGWQPSLPGRYTELSGIVYKPRPTSPAVSVTINGDRAAVVRTN